MIDSKTFSRQWINHLSAKYPKTDIILIEKAIRALSLLEALKETGMPFIFKGGTALMLMQQTPRRLSIDIDVIVPERPLDISQYFSRIVENSQFIRYEEQKRIANSQVDKAHFKFFYTPTYQTHSAQEYILLDILYERSPYTSLMDSPILSSLLSGTGRSLTVKTPTIANILGDKLTAFAPNTTGIPYYKGKTSMSLEIMKQLFDVASLFDCTNSLNEVSDTFYRIATNELTYRNLNNASPYDVLDDIFQTSLCISLRGGQGICRFQDLQQGIKRLSHFVISERFNIDNAVIAASKAAYLALLLKKDHDHLQYYHPTVDIANYTIQTGNYSKLNKLKKNNIEAFWYWYKAMEIF